LERNVQIERKPIGDKSFFYGIEVSVWRLRLIISRGGKTSTSKVSEECCESDEFVPYADGECLPEAAIAKTGVYFIEA